MKEIKGNLIIKEVGKRGNIVDYSYKVDSSN